MFAMLSPLDYVLLHLGNPGRYQLFVAFLIYCLQLPISFSGNLWKFYTEEPPHRCFIRSDQLNGTTMNEWIPTKKMMTIPDDFSSTVTSYSSCSMYIDPSNHWKGTQKCINGWEYKPMHGEHTITEEWDLVCESAYLIDLTFYGSILASIAGSIFFGLFADHFERKKSLLISLYLFLSAAFSLHFVQDYISFTICYLLQSAFIAGVHVTSYILLLELLPTPYQLQASLYLVAFSIASAAILPLIIWLIKSWRYVQLAVSAPGIVFLAHVWLLPQSPLWLTLEGKMNTAYNLIESMAAQNKQTSFPPSFRLHLQNMFNSFKNCGAHTHRHKLLHKFSSPCLRWYILVHFYLFFVIGLSQEVTDSHIMRLNGSKYADQFYSGLIDVGFLMFSYFFATRLGPRSTQSLLFVLSGLLMMASITIQEIIPKNSDVIPTTFDYRLFLLPSLLVLGSKSLLKTLPALIWYHCAKTLPTGVRVTGLASCFCWTLIGQAVAPYLLVLTHLIAPFIPIGLCGSLMVIGGGLSLLFPSCWRRPLPNTLEEAENKVVIPFKPNHLSFQLNGSSDGKQAFECLNRRHTLTSVSNLYTVPSTQPKFGQETNRGSDDLYYPPSVGGVDFYPLDSDTEIDSESALGGANGGGLVVGGLMVGDIGGSNWKLLSQFSNQDENGQMYDLKKTITQGNDNSRDMHVFSPLSSRSSEQIPFNHHRVPTAHNHHHNLPAHFVAETNL